MKARIGFVANSSSSMFIIINKSKRAKTYGELYKEIYAKYKTRVDEYLTGYINLNGDKDPHALIELGDKCEIKPGNNIVAIGDHGGIFSDSVLGALLEYMLVGGETDNFEFMILENNH